MRRLLRHWSSETSDALLYFVNNPDRQRLPYNERVPVTDIVGAAPRHPLVYYAAKAALRNAIWDSEKSITDTGRTTKIPPIKEGLNNVNRSWWGTKAGEDLRIQNGEGGDDYTVRFANGDDLLPARLSSPRTGPWMTILSAFGSDGGASAGDAAPSEEGIKDAMRRFAAEQKYVGIDAMFSCMEYTLDMYAGKKTTAKIERKD